MKPRRRRLALVLVALVLAGVLGYIFRAPLFRAVVAAAIDVATGYRVSFDSLTVWREGAIAEGVHVWRGRDPVLDVRSATLAYTLRDLLPGGTRRFGLRAISLEGAALWIVRRKDGTLNITGPSAAPSGRKGGAPSGAAPLRLSARVDDGSITILDPYRVYAGSRKIEILGVRADATLDSTAKTHYVVHGGVFSSARPREPSKFTLVGTIDQRRGYGIHRLTVGRLPLRDLINYVMNSRTAHLFAGDASNIDLRAYALDLGSPSFSGYHVSGRADVEGGILYVPGLIRPLRDLHGVLSAFDGGIAAKDLSGTLAGLPLHAAGSIYNWSQPTFWLGAVARGPSAPARTLFGFSEQLPIGGGPLAVRLLIEGPVEAPLIRTAFRSPLVTYDNLPLRDAAGEIDYYDSAVTLLPVRFSYGAFALNVRGGIDLNKTSDSNLIADAEAPPRSLPYVAQTLPGVALHLSATLVGNDVDIDARGVFDGSGGGDAIAGLFHLDRHGDGMFGPAEIVRSDGTLLAGAFYLNRSASRSGFWLAAHNFLLKGNPRHPTLPGIERLAPPEFDGVLDGALAGAGTPSTFQIAGRVHAHNVAYGPLAIADVSGTITGPPGDVRLAGVRATGPWGDFAGDGGYGDGRLALDGQYRGSFERLRPFTGDLGARGDVAGPVMLLVDSQRTLVQTSGASSPRADVRGIPIDSLRGTLAVAGKQLDLYAATANVAGGRFVAKGTLGGQGGLEASLAGAEARAFRSLGFPLKGGTIAASGTVRYEGALPTFDGAVALGGGRVKRIDVAGNGELRANVANVALRDSAALVGEAVAIASGTIEGLGGRPRYALSVTAHDVPIAPFARLVAPRRHDIAGTIDSDLTVVGEGFGAPSVSGEIAIPEGTFQGQAFSNLRARIGTGSNGIAAQNGSIVVGTTRADFSARLHGANVSLELDIPKANLADFDDLFDTGDTLGGRGRIVGDFTKHADNIVTNADVAIAGLRYRLFELGDARTRWSSKGRAVDGELALGGASGRLEANGILTLPARSRVERILQRSNFDGQVRLRGLELGTWLPLFGYELPVVGAIDADATLRGPLRAPTLHADATIVGGKVWKLPVDRAAFALDSTLTRATIRSAQLDLPNVVLGASGSFGFTPTSSLALAFHANSADVGALMRRLYGEQLPLSGAAEVDVRIDGSRAKPRITGGFDLEKAAFHRVAIARALGELSLQGRDVVLSDAEILFAKGGLYLAGSIPLQVNPFGLGPPRAPLALDVAAKGIDLVGFAPLLPTGSTLKGLLEGRVALNGTVADSRLIGDLALSGGAIESPYETVPLTNIRGALTFTSKTMTLESFHAEGGGGTLDASGGALFPDLVHPGADASYDLQAKAKGLRLNLPAYGQGQIDGTFAISHSPNKLAVVSGSATVQNGVIPFSALLLASKLGAAAPTIPSAGAPPAPPRTDLALDVNVAAANNVRVRSANVDIGGRGQLHVGGTLSALQLNGGFDSTGGTLGYFSTIFRVERADVEFRPDQGVVPSLDAVAATHVINPDPNPVRNPNGTADITLDATGLVTNLNVELSSDPPYDRQTILGLLLNAPAIGATNIFQSTLPGAATLPPGVIVNRGGGELTVAQEAFGILNAQFTRNLLSPIETQLGGALGLSNLALNVDYSGGLGLSAHKVLGKKVNLIYAQSFTYPYRETFGFGLKPSPLTQAQFTVFQTLGAQGVGSYVPAATLNPSQPTNQRALLAQPAAGTYGFSFSLQKLFK